MELPRVGESRPGLALEFLVVALQNPARMVLDAMPKRDPLFSNLGAGGGWSRRCREGSVDAEAVG